LVSFSIQSDQCFDVIKTRFQDLSDLVDGLFACTNGLKNLNEIEFVEDRKVYFHVFGVKMIVQ